MGAEEYECIALGLVFLPEVGLGNVEVEGHRFLKHYGGFYGSNVAELELQSPELPSRVVLSAHWLHTIV